MKAGSKAEALGVRPGDIVHSINGQSTNKLTLSDALSIVYSDNERLLLQLSTYVMYYSLCKISAPAVCERSSVTIHHPFTVVLQSPDLALVWSIVFHTTDCLQGFLRLL